MKQNHRWFQLNRGRLEKEFTAGLTRKTYFHSLRIIGIIYGDFSDGLLANVTCDDDVVRVSF